MAADPSLTHALPPAGNSVPKHPGTSLPVSFAEIFVQDLPPLPSLAALRALTDQELPSTDGLPMPDPATQREPLYYTVLALQWWYRMRRPGTCVAGDLLLYSEGWAETDGQVRAQWIVPDVLVAFGVGEHDRDSYVVWQEGKAPDFVMEIVSKSTWRRDVEEKPIRYKALLVKEYFLYDPSGEWLEPRLQGYVLGRGGWYQRLEAGWLGNGEWGLISEVLGLWVWLKEGKLRWSDAETGREFEEYDEAQERREAEDAARRAAEDHAGRDASAREAAEDRRKAAEDRARRDILARKAAEARTRRDILARKAAEAEAAELRARIRELESGSGTQ